MTKSFGDYEFALHLGEQWSSDSFFETYPANFVPRIGETIELHFEGQPRLLTVVDIKHTFIDDLCHVAVLAWRK